MSNGAIELKPDATPDLSKNSSIRFSLIIPAYLCQGNSLHAEIRAARGMALFSIDCTWPVCNVLSVKRFEKFARKYWYNDRSF
ncbi:MAG: hypothetical protein K8R76_01430 [Candidatus Aegiribacteria sp.]|nr:hypothetical protein [Candidatus Aegiribacteria sp.]